MKTLLITASLLFLAACGRQIEPEFQGLVTAFESEGNVAVGHLIVKFGDLPNKGERGICEKSPLSTPTITIDRATWAKQTQLQREKVLYHELGHCVLDRDHNETRDDYNQPISIMAQGEIDSGHYIEAHQNYMDELFGR